MPRTILLTYADSGFRHGQQRLCDSARRVGFDDAVATGPEDLAKTAFFSAHRAVLTQPRGGGYWLWKPYLIRAALAEMTEEDTLFYCDSSADGFYVFDRFPDRLVDRVTRSSKGFVIGPVLHQHGPLTRWTKRDALVLLDADRPDILTRPLLQATWSLWRKTDESLGFLDRWLVACCDPRVLTDRPNEMGLPDHEGFVDHRHDQSILSLLAYRDGIEVLDVSDTGIFGIMALRPESEMTHRFMKAPRNVERLLRGGNPALAYGCEAVRQAIGRRLKGSRA